MSLQSTNWQALINDAVSKGDLNSAAVFEQKRNEKINSPDYKGAQKPTDLYSGYLNAGADIISSMRDMAAYNSAQSAAQAQITRDWQVEQNAKAMEFSASEAAKNRDWQKMMSDTAHQREIADLKAAGLNPVLSAMGGNGAAVTSGATASGVTSAGATGQVDMSFNSALVNLLGSIYNRTTAIEAANINARTQESVADKYNATSQIVAQIAAAASRYGSDRTEIRAFLEYLPTLLSTGGSYGNQIVSALGKSKDSKVAKWFDSSEAKYYDYKRNGGDEMSFGELTQALVGAIKNAFK